MKIPIKYIIELGLIRKRDNCAKCGKKMDVKDYHIQLCKFCRNIYLKEYVMSDVTITREKSIIKKLKSMKKKDA